MGVPTASIQETLISMKVMNARIGTKEDLSRHDMIFEPKYDGVRAFCVVGKNMKFITRNGIDRTSKNPEFAFRKNIKAKTCILDGEIVAYDKKGRPDFSLLQQGEGKTEYVVFDILKKDGKNLTQLPLSERQKILKATVVNGGKLKRIISTTQGKKLWQQMKKKNYEGVMAKEKEGLYYPGDRSATWLKIKMIDSIDCIIIGYVQKKRLISSLVLGLYDSKKDLHYIGHVGTGFDQKEIKNLYAKLARIKAKRALLVQNVPKTITEVIWVRPKYVAEIKYLEFTRHKRLRATSYVRLRLDKKPAECTFAEQTK